MTSLWASILILSLIGNVFLAARYFDAKAALDCRDEDNDANDNWPVGV